MSNLIFGSVAFCKKVMLFFGTSLILVGCGSAGPNVKFNDTAKGTLKYTNGTPVANVNVQLVPDDPKIPRAGGTTDQNGTFTFKRADGKAGAPIGTYKVILIANIPGQRSRDPDKDQADLTKSARLPRGVENPNNTTLTLEIKANK